MSMELEIKKCEHSFLYNDNFCYHCGALRTSNVSHFFFILDVYLQTL